MTAGGEEKGFTARKRQLLASTAADIRSTAGRREETQGRGDTEDKRRGNDEESSNKGGG